MDELKIVLEQEHEAVIVDNFDELEKAVNEIALSCKGNVYTEESINVAKKDVAYLRTVVSDLKSGRTRIKKEVLKVFEEKANPRIDRMIETIEKVIEPIVVQIDIAVEKQKEEKKEKILELFDEKTKDVCEYITFDEIFNEKWLNVSASFKSINEDMDRIVLEITSSIDAIKSQNSEKVDEAIGLYKETRSLAQAIKLITDFEREKARIIEQQKQKEQAEREERERKEREDRLRFEREQKEKEEQIEREKQEAIERAEKEKELAIQKAKEEAESEMQRKLDEERKKVETEMRFKQEEKEKKEREEAEKRRIIQEETERKLKEQEENDRIQEEKDSQERIKNGEDTFSVIVNCLNRERAEQLATLLNGKNYMVEIKPE